jgi:AcrR family transcriptional regulator
VSTTRRRSTGSPTGLARKELILSSAAKVFAAKGFSSATVRDIADEAEILSGSLYYYFDSKEAIVEEVLVTYLDEMVRGYHAAVAESRHHIGMTQHGADGVECAVRKIRHGQIQFAAAFAFEQQIVG